MAKRPVPLVIGGLLLAVFVSLALAQEPVSQKDWNVSTSILGAHVERREPLSLSEGQVISRVVMVEPVRLQIPERVAGEIRVSSVEPLLQAALLTEHDHGAQPLRGELRALTEQVLDEVHSISLSVSRQCLVSAVTRLATTCVVVSMVDSGPGTLRRCLEDAVVGDTITFDEAVFPPTSPVTISLASALPWINIANLTIDGSNAGVILDGSGVSSGDGFTIVGTNGVRISGLQILYFPRNGITVGLGAVNTTIGGDRFTGSGPLGQGNLISGNGLAGVWFQDSAMGSAVLGNYIGTNISGTAALGNASDGVVLMDGAMNNTIGGDTPGTRNVISGNGDAGVQIQDPDTSGNQVIGNYIGTDASGTIPLGNQHGVLISSTTDNTIGGDSPGARNLISGNRERGVQIQLLGTSGNRVLGNYIGTDVSGSGVLGNGSSGVILVLTTDSVIGGDTPGALNLISGNGDAGVWIEGSGTSRNHVLGNHIGTDISGTAPISNHWGVVILDGPTDNRIGGDSLSARNLISGNGDAGVWIEGSETSGNHVLGNYIGTNVSGTSTLGNGNYGVLVGFETTNNIIGGNAPEARNLISGNGDTGVWIQNAGTMSNTVLGNYIGTDVSGTISIPNYRGVRILEGPTHNTVGGTGYSAHNLVSGNTYGVVMQDSGTANNTVLGNYIGTDSSGTAALGNQLAGVVIGNEAMSNTIGGNTSEARNFISGNEVAGVAIWDAGGTVGNQVLGNYIGTDVSGTAAIPNHWGVYIASGATSNVIGSDPDAGNLISGNEEAGVWIQDAGTSNNRVSGNYICNNAGYGVFIGYGATHNTIGISNTIVYNALDGVVISGTNTLYNTVTRNIIHHNGGLPINLVTGPIPVSPPMLNNFSCFDNTVWGTACPGCLVEVFANPTTMPAGTIFLGDVQADSSGDFGLTLAGLPHYPYLAATATNPDGTTSEFSDGFLLAGSTLTPTSTTVTVSSSATVIYTHTLINIGLCTDTFTLSASSDRGWLDVYRPSTVTLARGTMAPVIVTVTVPDGLTYGTIDRTVVTATSSLVPHAVTTAEDVTIFGFRVYLPLVVSKS
jgi:hypothetical protein